MEQRKDKEVTFKSTNLTLTYYTTTLTVQFQGSKASESITPIKSLKDMHPKALLSTTFLDSTSDPLFSSSLDLSSRSSEGHLDSHDCNLANFNPATPELNVSEDIDNRLSVARKNCVTFQTELKRIRDEKHNLWLRNQEIPSDNSNLEPKGKDSHVNQDYVTHTVVLQTLTHANKLIENLDI